MSTEFGNIMKDVMKVVGDEDNKVVTTNREKKGKTVSYDIQSSGIDMIATRYLNGKETRQLVVFLSRTDDAGNAIVVLKEKKTVLDVNKQRLNSFLDGCDSPVKTGCTAVPYLRKGVSFIESFLEIVEDKSVQKYVKLGLLDTEVLMGLREKSYYNRLIKPWFKDCTYSSGFRYNDDKENCDDNAHFKLVKTAIGYNMRVFNMSYNEALYALYQESNNNRYGDNVFKSNRKVVTGNILRAMIVLANRYDEPFAIKCLEEYMDTDNLSGIEYESLDKILRIKSGAKYEKNRWSDTLSQYVSSDSLLYKRLTEAEENRAVTFDKNRLWEYLLQSASVGLGRNMSSYLTTWKDYLQMANDINNGIIEKYPDALQIAHDICQEKYEVSGDERLKNGLFENTKKASEICDCEVSLDGSNTKYQFRILRTPNEFVDEANQQSNCVASYMQRCSCGDTLVGSMREVGADRTELTIEVRPEDYKIIQVRGRFNKMPTDKQNKIVEKIQHKIYKNLKIKELRTQLEDFDESGDKDDEDTQ